MHRLRANRLALFVFLFGLLTLSRAEAYYGRLLRGWDAQFYYAMARSLVLDRDTDLSNDLPATPYPEPFDADRDGVLEAIPHGPDGRVQTKYPVGLSLIEAPFLAAGAALRQAATPQAAAVGFSRLEIGCVAVGLLLVFAAGMQSFARLVEVVVPRPWCEAAVLTAWAGTSLLYYSAVFPFMAHAAAFALIAWCLRLARLVAAGAHPTRDLALLGAVLGLLFLTRPQQVLLGLSLAAYLAVAKSLPLRKYAAGLIAGGSLFAAAVALQAAVNATQFGRFTLNAYSQGGEGFDWLHPDFAAILVGRARGLLVFSPVVLLGLAGYALGWRRMPGVAWVLLVHAVGQVYVVACWSSPDQGDAFGARMWCECAGVVAFGLAGLFTRRSATRWAALLVAGAAALWTTFLMAGYVSGRFAP